jgi:hypothetical protein
VVSRPTIQHSDIVEIIQWFFSGRSDELIVTEAHGHFFPTPTFSGRVSKTTNAGIDVDRIQTQDSGNYSVELLVRTASGNVETLWRSAYVHATGRGVTNHRLELKLLLKTLIHV